MGRCPCFWCNFGGKIQVKINMYLQHTWFPNIWVVHMLCELNIGEGGLPLWFICIILLFKEMVYGRNCCYLPKSHIINATKCIHWENKNKGSTYMGIYIKCYQMGLGTNVVARRFKKTTWWKTWPCTKKQH